MMKVFIAIRSWFHRLLTTSRFGYVLIAFIVFVISIGLTLPIQRDMQAFYSLFNFNYTKDHHLRYLIIGFIGMIFISGALMMLFTNGIQRWVERIREGRKVFHGITGHYVMIGYNRMSINIINRLDLGIKTRLIILTRKNPIQIRAELQTLMAKKEKYIIIYAGGRDLIKKLNLEKAKEAFILVESNDWENQYTHSMAMLEEVARNASKRSSQLKTNLYINEVTAYNMIGQLDMPEFEGIQQLDIHPFNFYDNWARLLWSYNGKRNPDGSYFYDQLDFEPIANTDKHVHLAIVGFNSMGRALWQEAVRIAHYPNFDETTGKNPSVITVIDPRAKEIEEELLTQYPDYPAKISDIKFEFKANRIEDHDIRQALETWALDKNELLTLAICFSDADRSLSTALALPEKLFFSYNNMQLKPKNEAKPDGRQILVKNYSRTHILVRQSVRRALDKLLDANNEKYVNMKFFGNYEGAFSEDLLDDYLSICVNGIYNGCGEGGKPLGADFYNIQQLNALDIHAHYKYWEQLWLQSTSEQNKLSTRYQIDHYRSTLPIVEQNFDNTLAERLAQSEHLRWIAERTLAGWRQVENGEKRVNELKLHIDMKPYHQLEEKEKKKDLYVVLFVKTLVKAQKEMKKSK